MPALILNQAGWDVIHVVEIEMSRAAPRRATGVEIFEAARPQQSRVQFCTEQLLNFAQWPLATQRRLRPAGLGVMRKYLIASFDPVPFFLPIS